MRTGLAATALAATLMGCGDHVAARPMSTMAGPAGGTAPPLPAVGEPFPGTLPASFSGDLPCADCPGIRHIVELHPDNVFVYRMTYLGRGEDGKGRSIDDIGRWTISDDGRVLTLHGDREARALFAVTDGRALRKLDLEGREIESSLNYDLVRAARFEPIEAQRLMRGMYSYMADAGLFSECSTGWRLPVAMEADNVTLERGYRAAQRAPGEPVLVTLEGRIAMRPPMEGAGLQRSLVPVRFVKALPGETCQEAGGGTPMNSLSGTGWRLVSATPGVPAPGDVSRITLKFSDTRLSASSGCNTGTGAYTVEADRLVAPMFATTRKACLGPLEQWEPAFFRVLSSKPTIARDGDSLVLGSAEGEMRFRSMPVPSAAAVQKFIYVAAQRAPCTGVAGTSCLQIRERETDPWRLHHGEIVGFTHQPGIEYRLRILEDEVRNPSSDASSTRWFLDLVVEQRVVKP